LRYFRKSEFAQELVVTGLRVADLLLQVNQRVVCGAEIDFRVWLGRADVARDVVVVSLSLDLRHPDASGEALLFLPELVCLDDLVDVLFPQNVLALAFLVMLRSVDEQNVVVLLALLEDEDADGNAG